MKKTVGFLIMVILISGGLKGQNIPIREILEAFINDFKFDPAVMDRPVTFGIRVKQQGEWHVVVDGKGGVELKKGMPSIPSMYYVTDPETLRMIYRRQMSALTAMGRASISEPTPLDFGYMEGFRPDSDFLGWGIKFTFHFWTRGIPEVVSFGKETASRFIHGAQAKIIYYQKGLRTGWYQILKGQHINADPADQKNPFPTLIMMINGVTRARIDDKLIEMKKGDCLHIPAGSSHEFWNDQEEPAEFVIVMFGRGA